MLGIFLAYIVLLFSASKSWSVAAATATARWWLRRRQRVYPFASVSLRVIATPDCASTFDHDLIVSAAVYTACTRTRTHSYARHVHARTYGRCVCWTHRCECPLRSMGSVRACRRIYAYGLRTYTCVRVRRKKKRECVKGGEERGTKCALEIVETPWILETTRISLAQLMNIDVPFSTARPHLYHSFLF